MLDRLPAATSLLTLSRVLIGRVLILGRFLVLARLLILGRPLPLRRGLSLRRLSLRRGLARRRGLTLNLRRIRTCLLVEDLVVVVLQQVLDLDATRANQGLARRQEVAEIDVLVAVQQLAPDFHQPGVLGQTGFADRLVAVGLAFELGALGVLAAGDVGGFLVGALPLVERLVAFGEALIELVDRLAQLLLRLAHIVLGRIDLGLEICRLPICLGEPRLQGRPLVLQRPRLGDGLTQRFAQPIGLRLGAGARGGDHRHEQHRDRREGPDAHDQNFALRSTWRTSTAYFAPAILVALM